MSHAVIITAKGNNVSIPGKNITKVAGKPCFFYGLEAGKQAKRISRVFVYSNDARIRSMAEDQGAIALTEPPELADPSANHGDAIRHAVELVREKYLPDLEIVTLLLGNVVAVSPELIDLSVELVEKNPDLDSSMSVWRAQDDHPYRALKILEDGTLASFLGVQSGTARQSYPSVYYYDQGVWTFRWQNVLSKDGPNPWWWMGKRSFPIVRNWVTGRDSHTQLDLDFFRYWVENGHKDEILNMDDIQNRLNAS